MHLRRKSISTRIAAMLLVVPSLRVVAGIALAIAPAIAPAIALTLSPSTASAAPSKHDEALALFDQGRAAYKEGRFADSVDLINKAYQLEKEPVLLYNLGRAYEGLGEYENAVSTFEQYLRDGKDIQDRAAIEQRVSSMKKSIAEKARLAKERDEALKGQADKPKAAPRAVPTAAPDRRAASPIPWIFAGVGAAGLGAGAALGVTALSKNRSAEKAPSQQAAVDQHDSAKGLALGSTIAFVAGGVLLAGGATWGIVDLTTRGPRSTDKPEVKLGFGPTSASLDIRF